MSWSVVALSTSCMKPCNVFSRTWLAYVEAFLNATSRSAHTMTGSYFTCMSSGFAFHSSQFSQNTGSVASCAKRYMRRRIPPSKNCSMLVTPACGMPTAGWPVAPCHRHLGTRLPWHGFPSRWCPFSPRSVWFLVMWLPFHMVDGFRHTVVGACLHQIVWNSLLGPCTLTHPVPACSFICSRGVHVDFERRQKHDFSLVPCHVRHCVQCEDGCQFNGL